MGREVAGYWGKADPAMGGFHLLAFHSLDVAAVATVLLRMAPRWLQELAGLSGCTVESLQRVVPFLMALHDLGKFSDPFQDQRPDLVAVLQGMRSPRHGRRHDTLGYLLWRAWLQELRFLPASEQGLAERHFQITVGGQRQTDRGELERLFQPWMAAILGHHGRPPEEGNLGGTAFRSHPKTGQDQSRVDAAAFVEAAHRLLEPGELVALEANGQEERMRRSSWWLAGFAILCDWLGSDTDHFPYAREELPLADYWPKALSRAEAAVDGSGLLQSSPRTFSGIAGLFPELADRASPLQQAAATVELSGGPQLFVLEELTGGGKTEAALLLAHRLMAAGQAEGIFFALPTMATANAMHSRVEPLAARLFEGSPSYLLTHSGPRLTEQDRLRLARGTSGERDTYGSGEHDTASRDARSWLADGRKKALLAELGVGTIDQALLASLQSRHAALRLFGLHRHVLVVDEVHACDAYMLEVLCALLEMHALMGGSAILLSATLPLEQRQRLCRAFGKGRGLAREHLPDSAAYPLLTALGEERVQELPVAPRKGSARPLELAFHRTTDEVVQRLIQAAGEGRCAAWVRNSVADALEAWELLSEALGAENVTLFHARFALADRLHAEQAVLERFGKAGEPGRRRGHIVVATQVIEQSIDVDFDVMVSDLPPIDLCIQRAGRLQRHPDLHPGRPAPVLELFAPPYVDEPPPGWLGGPFRRTSRVYDDPGVLWRTLRELERRRRLVLPDDARALVEAVYGAREVPSSLEKRAMQSEGKELSHASVAQQAALKPGMGYLREGIDWSSECRTTTRLGEPTVTLRLARVGPDGAVTPWSTALARHLHWPLSQVSVARRLICSGAPEDEALRKSAESTQPFLGDDIVTLPLRETADGHWECRGIAEQRQGNSHVQIPIRVRYSPLRGIEIQKENQ